MNTLDKKSSRDDRVFWAVILIVCVASLLPVFFRVIRGESEIYPPAVLAFSGLFLLYLTRWNTNGTVETVLVIAGIALLLLALLLIV